MDKRFKAARFQSTLPARGATSFRFAIISRVTDFNPRSPHGERPVCLETISDGGNNFNPRSPHGERQTKLKGIEGSEYISIHAPRTGSDPARRDNRVVSGKISIHAPRTGSDPTCQGPRWKCGISIHAPRTGSDTRPNNRFSSPKLISIHAPRTGSDLSS